MTATKCCQHQRLPRETKPAERIPTECHDLKQRSLRRSGLHRSGDLGCSCAPDAGAVEVAPGRAAGRDGASPSGFSPAGGALDGSVGVVGAARLAPTRCGGHLHSIAALSLRPTAVVSVSGWRMSSVNDAATPMRALRFRRDRNGFWADLALGAQNGAGCRPGGSVSGIRDT